MTIFGEANQKSLAEPESAKLPNIPDQSSYLIRLKVIKAFILIFS